MIIFHDGNNQAFADYTGGRAWNDNTFAGATIPRFASLDVEANVVSLFEKSKEALKVAGSMDAGVASKDVNIYILKRAHQPPNGGMIAYSHITVGWDGYIWHLEVWAVTGNPGVAIMGSTRGDERWQDGDGFEVVKKKKR